MPRRDAHFDAIALDSLRVEGFAAAVRKDTDVKKIGFIDYYIDE